jgi:DNA invertase Pin-like site-specific DNA recombinase
MGRLTLNILLSFAQFEREIIGERIRDKLAAQCRRGQWTGGYSRHRIAWCSRYADAQRPSSLVSIERA